MYSKVYKCVNLLRGRHTCMCKSIVSVLQMYTIVKTDLLWTILFPLYLYNYQNSTSHREELYLCHSVLIIWIVFKVVSLRTLQFFYILHL